MTERASTPIGHVSWTDVGTPDLDAATEFYGALFGWTFERGGEEFGGYTTAWQNGREVAGLMPLMSPEQPPAWSLYFAVDDADAAAKTAIENGATQVAEPMDVGTLGRMWIAFDPTGAFFGVWQARDMAGFQLVDEPGSTCWFELGTRDRDRANAFYATFLPWDYEQIGDGGFDYTVVKVGEDRVAGTMPMPPEMPAEIPPHWMVYFAVADCDQAVEQITASGGGVARPAMDSPYGRFAIVRDPWGAHFAVNQLPSG